MDKDELENNLGTIASSGSYKFRQQLKDEDKENVDIIGQFGVGFYSAFMVAKEITVITRKYGSDTGYKWQSAGADGYTIEEYNKDTVGTDIIMVLKDDTEEDKYSEYLEQYRLSSLIKKYSDYIRYPIEMDMESTKVKEGTEEKPEYETVVERKTLNSMVPIWQKAKKDVTKEEYNNFYKEKFFDFEDPLLTITTSVEGVVTYKALLYIPAKTPYNYYTKEYEKGLQLYSSGVMIMENCPDLLPEHFRFVKGVVDSQDLSLNISREMLQHNRQLKLIEEHLEKKIKNELASMLKKDRENYEKFFAAFGRQLKYGLVSDYGAHKDKLSDLILFYSYNQKKLITLDEYVEAMKEDQKYIYFATGESKEIIETLPQTEILKDKGFDFLCCTDEIDEFALNSLRTFKEKEFRSVLNDDLGIESENKEEEKEEGQDALITFIKETLGDKDSQVVASKKLKSHPVCLTAQGGISFEMEKYFSVVQPESGMKAQRVLEINMSHPAVKALKDKVTTNIEEAKKYVQLLYSQSLLIAGLPLENPSEYTDLVCSLMI